MFEPRSRMTVGLTDARYHRSQVSASHAFSAVYKARCYRWSEAIFFQQLYRPSEHQSRDRQTDTTHMYAFLDASAVSIQTVIPFRGLRTDANKCSELTNLQISIKSSIFFTWETGHYIMSS